MLGLGNLLLSDDAAGLHLEAALLAELGASPRVEYVDGGTQGLALLHYLANRRAVLVLDAVGLGAEPGSVHVLRGPAIDGLRVQRATTAHEGNALELLATAQLLGDEPDELVIIGIEPDHVRTGVGLSEAVSAHVAEAAALAVEVLRSQVLRFRVQQEGPCVSRSPVRFSIPKN